MSEWSKVCLDSEPRSPTLCFTDIIMGSSMYGVCIAVWWIIPGHSILTHGLNETIYYLTVSVAQESGLGWVWCSGSRKGTITMFTGGELCASHLARVVGSTEFLAAIALSTPAVSGDQAEATVLSQTPSSTAHQMDLPTWPPTSSTWPTESVYRESGGRMEVSAA